MSDKDSMSKLAIHGGSPAVSEPPAFMLPGIMAYDEEEETAVLEVVRSRNVYRFMDAEGGSQCEQLEDLFRESTGRKHALAVTSGTAALLCALQGLGVGPGDEVIVPAFGWIASISAILGVGAVPIITEVDESLTLDPEAARANISPFTKAIMPVHMRGVPANLDPLLELAKQHDLKILEDTAQANGGSFQGRQLGSFGDAGAYSLQASKIITSGEGGMVVSDQDEVYARAAMFHDPFSSRLVNLPESEAMWGLNFRMTEVAAAIARVQFSKRKRIIDAMRVRKALIKNGIANLAASKSVSFRHLHDESGDTGLALIMFMPNQEDASRVNTALQAENISCNQLYTQDSTDQHVYASWNSVLSKKQWSDHGGPWTWASRDVQYSRDMCPRTLDLLTRAVQIHISPIMSNVEVEENLDGITKVFSELL